MGNPSLNVVRQLTIGLRFLFIRQQIFNAGIYSSALWNLSVFVHLFTFKWLTTVF